jgi:outer membrane biosynthesis protein TonB
MNNRDLQGLLGAVLLHGLAALAILCLQPASSRLPRWIELQIMHPEPPAAPPPVAESPPAEPEVQWRKPPPEAPGPVRAPVPNLTRPDQEPLPENREPPKPAFGISKESVVPQVVDTAPVGNTTIGPSEETSDEVEDLPPPPDGSTPGFHPTSPLDLSEEAVAIGDSCIIPDSLYPEEARAGGIQGITQLRLQIDARGKVRGARILLRAGEVLDEMARTWAREHCRFRPARDRSSRPVASLLTFTYDWHIVPRNPYGFPVILR